MSQDVERYIQLLQSSDPAKRKGAIIALGKLGDRRALKPLAQVYKTDPDESLRTLAKRAGMYIQKQSEAPAASSPPRSQAFVSDAGQDAPDWVKQQAAPPPKKVSERDRKKAQMLKERAIDAQVRGDQEGVVDALAEAMALNPALEKDNMILGLLAGATGMDGAEAVAELKRVLAEEQASGKKRKSSASASYNEILDFFIEIAIWLIVIALFGGGGIFLSLNDMDWATLQQEVLLQNPQLDPIETASFFSEADAFFERYGVIASLILGFVYSAFIVGVAMFMGFVTWFVGSMFLSGEGLIFPFLKAMLRVTIAYLVISTVLSGLGQLFSPGSSPTIFLGLMPTVLGIGITAWVIGKEHRFGMGMGCVNMVGTVVFCGVCSCCSIFLLANS